MTVHPPCGETVLAPALAPATDTEPANTIDPATDAAEGWQALALATLGRQLTRAELDVAATLPAEHALDRLFPGLPDAARHEALWALG